MSSRRKSSNWASPLTLGLALTLWTPAYAESNPDDAVRETVRSNLSGFFKKREAEKKALEKNVAATVVPALNYRERRRLDFGAKFTARSEDLNRRVLELLPAGDRVAPSIYRSPSLNGNNELKKAIVTALSTNPRTDGLPWDSYDMHCERDLKAKGWPDNAQFNPCAAPDLVKTKARFTQTLEQAKVESATRERFATLLNTANEELTAQVRAIAHLDEMQKHLPRCDASEVQAIRCLKFDAERREALILFIANTTLLIDAIDANPVAFGGTLPGPALREKLESNRKALLEIYDERVIEGVRGALPR